MNGLKLLFLAVRDEFKTLICINVLSSRDEGPCSVEADTNDYQKQNKANRASGYLSNRRRHEEVAGEKWSKPSKIEVWQFLLAVLTFIVGLFLAVIYFKQMQANSRQADAAERQLGEMRKQDILDQRAWVVVDSTSSEYVSFNPNLMDLIVEFRNVGKTPALNIQALLLGAAGEGPISTNDVQQGNETRHGMLAPNGTIPIRTFPHMREDQVALVKSGTQFRLFGTVWYDDIFGQHHWSQFCYKISFLGTNNAVKWQPTPEHNTCDDDKLAPAVK